MSKSGYGSNQVVTSLNSPFLKRVISFIYPPMPTLNTIPHKKKEIIKENIFNGKIVLNIGSGADSGSGKWLWKDKVLTANKTINLDITLNENISFIADAHDLPVKDESIDSVVMQALIEHIVDPVRVIKEAHRVLKPGGFIYLEVPFLQGFHADPYDYQRYTLPGLRNLTSDFEDISSGVSVGPFCSLVWLIRDGFSSCFKNKFLFNLSRFLLAWILSPLRYLDYFSRHTNASKRLANEFFLLGRKADS